MTATCENIPPDGFNWSHRLAITLLEFMCELKSKAKDYKINKSFWKSVTERFNVSYPPSADLRQKKFYAIKRTVRSFMAESNKTGSGTPKPFIYETAMHSLLSRYGL